jgi:hypothetical protein
MLIRSLIRTAPTITSYRAFLFPQSVLLPRKLARTYLNRGIDCRSHIATTRTITNELASNMTSPTAKLGNYELLTHFQMKYAPVTVAKYRSTRTGFSVVVADNKAPITNAYFTVATEIFDDSGRPHTLEHLVFLGSKDYPYKGVLDNLANRAGGDGTNAWTADDRETLIEHCVMSSS